MLAQPILDAAIGTMATVGGIIYFLNKYGIIKIGAKKEEKKEEAKIKNTPFPMIVEKCPEHPRIDKVVAEIPVIRRNQTANMEKHKSHEIALEEGRKDFREVKRDLKITTAQIFLLRESIVLLLVKNDITKENYPHLFSMPTQDQRE